MSNTKQGQAVPTVSPAWRSRFAPILVLLLLGGACGSDLTTGAFYPTSAFVYGQVRDEAGLLQQHAVVEVIPYYEDCDRPRPAAEGVKKPSALGEYQLLLAGPHFSEFTACLVVNATVESEDGVLRGSVRNRTVNFYSTRMGRIDSVRVDVVVGLGG